MHRKRSEYFCSYEQYLLDTPGSNPRDIAACRQKADIIVTAGPLPAAAANQRTFQDLQLALGEPMSRFFSRNEFVNKIYLTHFHC